MFVEIEFGVAFIAFEVIPSDTCIVLYISEFIVVKINYSQLNLIPTVLLVKPR